MSTSSHEPSLTPIQRKIHIIFRIFLIILTGTAGMLFVKELLFPTYAFHFRSAVDSLANTISRPYITEFGTTFDVSATGDFTETTISITLPKGAKPLSENTKLSTRHSYLAFLTSIDTEKYTDHIITTYEIDGVHYVDRDNVLYPFLSDNIFDSYLFAQNTVIPTESATDLLARTAPKDLQGFASGTLIKSQDGVFVIDGTTKHPFQDELSVTALGYKFDNIRASTSDERALHEKARMFDTKSTHPFGTIFWARDAQRMYIYDKDQLHKIEPSVRAKEHAIIVDEASRTTFDVCTLSRNLLRPRTYSCTIPLSQTAAFPGNMYQFMIDTPHVAIDESHITFSTAPTHASLSQRITFIKKELRKYYSQRNE